MTRSIGNGNMALEIERKFLVADDSWRKFCKKSERLKDGLIAITDEGRKVRVRLYEGRATLTVKSPGEGLKRDEFEYEIPLEDAHELIKNHCGDFVLTKTRHTAPFEGFNWQIDVYEGLLDGVKIAEVEVDRVDAEVPLPPWVDREVTGNPDYTKINMFRKRLAEARMKEAISPASLRYF